MASLSLSGYKYYSPRAEAVLDAAARGKHGRFTQITTTQPVLFAESYVCLVTRPSKNSETTPIRLVVYHSTWKDLQPSLF
jgi:hypothetical protein